MSNSLLVTKIIDGARSAVFHVFIESDGASGEITNGVLIDPGVDFDPALGTRPCITVEEIWYDLTGFSAKLSFNELQSGTPAWACSGDRGTHLDFDSVGGIKDRSARLDGNGKLLVSTAGLASGTCGSMMIKVRKS